MKRHKVYEETTQGTSRLYINVYVGERLLTAIIDTGATTTIMHSKLLKKSYSVVSSESIQGVCSCKIESILATVPKIIIGEKILSDTLVTFIDLSSVRNSLKKAKQKSYDIIIGMDLIKKLKLISY